MANQARVKMADINYPPAGFINNSLCVRLNHKKYHIKHKPGSPVYSPDDKYYQEVTDNLLRNPSVAQA